MNIRNRLLKLEQRLRKPLPPLIIIKFDRELVHEEQKQIAEAEAVGRETIVINFTDA